MNAIFIWEFSKHDISHGRRPVLCSITKRQGLLWKVQKCQDGSCKFRFPPSPFGACILGIKNAKKGQVFLCAVVAIIVTFCSLSSLQMPILWFCIPLFQLVDSFFQDIPLLSPLIISSYPFTTGTSQPAFYSYKAESVLTELFHDMWSMYRDSILKFFFCTSMNLSLLLPSICSGVVCFNHQLSKILSLSSCIRWEVLSCFYFLVCIKQEDSEENNACL